MPQTLQLCLKKGGWPHSHLTGYLVLKLKHSSASPKTLEISKTLSTNFFRSLENSQWCRAINWVPNKGKCNFKMGGELCNTCTYLPLSAPMVQVQRCSGSLRLHRHTAILFPASRRRRGDLIHQLLDTCIVTCVPVAWRTHTVLISVSCKSGPSLESICYCLGTN